MPDREKVISWVEGLAEDDWRLFHSESEVQNIAKAVLALLKDREPLAVCEGKVNKCVCENEINRCWNPEYCGFCGKKLLWY